MNWLMISFILSCCVARRFGVQGCVFHGTMSTCSKLPQREVYDRITEVLWNGWELPDLHDVTRIFPTLDVFVCVHSVLCHPSVLVPSFSVKCHCRTITKIEMQKNSKENDRQKLQSGSGQNKKSAEFPSIISKQLIETGEKLYT
jgi:hypothetical protein